MRRFIIRVLFRVVSIKYLILQMAVIFGMASSFVFV